MEQLVPLASEFFKVSDVLHRFDRSLSAWSRCDASEHCRRVLGVRAIRLDRLDMFSAQEESIASGSSPDAVSAIVSHIRVLLNKR